MLYKRLDNGKLQWPKDEKEVRNLTILHNKNFVGSLKVYQFNSQRPFHSQRKVYLKSVSSLFLLGSTK
ncbi:hypothetical protein JDS96_21545 [Bacillus cereus group sp. N21]|nr:hypothetical protein [Bacillus cereus group sp. N21]